MRYITLVLLLLLLSSTYASSVHFTFDDWCNEQTLHTANELYIRWWRGTFFVNWKDNSCVRSLIRSWHMIGNHTYNHTDITKISAAQLKREIRNLDTQINQVTKYFRPPFLRIQPYQLPAIKSLGKKISMPTVDCPDWLRKSSTLTTNCILQNTKSWSVIMLHEKFSGPYIGSILDALQKSWYSFTTLP